MLWDMLQMVFCQNSNVVMRKSACSAWYTTTRCDQSDFIGIDVQLIVKFPAASQSCQ